MVQEHWFVKIPLSLQVSKKYKVEVDNIDDEFDIKDVCDNDVYDDGDRWDDHY